MTVRGKQAFIYCALDTLNSYSFNISIGKDYFSPDWSYLYSFGVLTEDVWTKAKRKNGGSDLSWGGENWSEEKKMGNQGFKEAQNI